LKAAVSIVSLERFLQILELDEPRFSHSVSIRDPDDPISSLLPRRFEGWLSLEFHDIDRAQEMADGRPPSRKDAEALRDFWIATNTLATGYLVHCHAGFHRSAAAGLALLRLQTGSETLAYEAFVKVRPLGAPNRTFIRLLDEVLGTHLWEVSEALWDRTIRFFRGEFALHPDDYLDELGSPL